MKSDCQFLTFEEVPIGSWWSMASGGTYGYCVVGKNPKTQDVSVISTEGESRKIDFLKLQYRYKRVLPNEENK